MGVKLRDMFRGETEGDEEQNTEENVWTYMGGNKRDLEKTA
jgi:hypothetical protein